VSAAPVTAPAQRDTAAWQQADRRHHVHPFVDPAILKEKGPRVVKGAEGCYLIDSDGRRILDGMAGLWCVNVGYGRRELVEAARKQMEELPYYNTFFRSAPTTTIRLTERLSELAPGNLRHVFFSSSGSEASDTVVRLIRRYWDLKGRPEKTTFISRTYAYHGSTMAAASLGGFDAMHAVGGLPLPGFAHIMPPYWFVFAEEGETPDQLGMRAATALEAKIDELGPDKVAAFIGEPVQGAGGVIPPPAGYWAEVQRICRERDILLVADEVITGFGRTGRWFGSETFDIQPDVMTIAKGLSSGYCPISGVILSDPIFAALEDGGAIPHGYTYSGHPVSAAVALENLRIIEEEKLPERVRDDIGPYFHRRAAELRDHPLVGEVRGCGMLLAVELSPDRESRALFDPQGTVAALCHELCWEEGVVIRNMRDVMCAAPPLTISRAEVDELFEKFRGALDRTAAEAGRG